MPKFMALDYGLERIGLALSDPTGSLAFPLAVVALTTYGARSAQLDAVVEIARSEKVEALVIGLPRGLDGEETPMCAVVRNVVPRLKRRLGLPIYGEDEYGTSRAAERGLARLGLGLKKRKGLLDQAAAQRILEAFLAAPPDSRELL